ncbi:L-rhamnose mutarotase [Ahrensia kielensis]|uniref:L-rhamnose mutarotase n=1 Tax=Ahrensia kielensis TaxID=76980 RepID=A0ABU9TA01_9HYPH
MNRRIAMVINVRPEHREEYLRLHKEPDPIVMQALRDANHVNYTIFNLGNLLVCTFTYTGKDLDADRTRLRQRPDLQDWMQKTANMQEQFEVTQEGNWWSVMDEVLHDV